MELAACAGIEAASWSADPATLARDVATLTSYKIDKLTLVDLFPQTYHLETVAHLSRR